MAITAEKLLKLQQLKAGLQSAKNYTDSEVGKVKTLIGTLPEGASATDVVGYINKKTEGIATDEALQTLQAALNTLIADDTNKSARAISAEEVAKIVAGADESFDTLKEIADWISTHKSDATAMNSAITTLEAILDGIGGTGQTATVKKYIDDAITALKIGDYAKAADVTALAARVTALETGKADAATTLAGYGITDAYTKTAADEKIKELIGTEVTITMATDDEVTAACNEVFGAA